MSSFSSTAGGVGGVGDSKEPIRGASTNGVDSSSRLPSLSPPPTGPSSSTTSASKQGGHILNNSVASSSPSSSYRPGSLVVGGDSVGITINPLETASVRSASSGGNGNQAYQVAPMSEVPLVVTSGGSGSGNSNSNSNNTGSSQQHNTSANEGGGNSHHNNSSSSPVGTESPGTSQMSPPPSYNDIPGTVRPLNRDVPPPSYEDAVDPNGEPPSYDSLFGRILDTHKASRNMADFLLRLLLLLIGTIGCTVACSVTVVIPVVMIVVGAVHFDDCPAEPYIPVFLIVGGAFLVAKYLIGVATRVRRGSAARRARRERLEQQQQQQQGQQDLQVDPAAEAELAYRESAVGAFNGEVAPATADERGRDGGRRTRRGTRRGRDRGSPGSDDDDLEEDEVHPAQSIISCFLCAWFITGCVWVYRIYEPVMDPALSGDPHYCNATVYVFAFWFITTAYIFLGLVTSCICCISIYAQTRTEREQ